MTIQPEWSLYENGLRGLPLGSEEALIRPHEISLGTKVGLLPVKHHNYHCIHLGEEAVSQYMCYEGIMYEQTVSPVVDTLERAIEIYREYYTDAVKNFGQPTTDEEAHGGKYSIWKIDNKTMLHLAYLVTAEECPQPWSLIIKERRNPV